MKSVFQEPPTVAYRRPKILSSYLVKKRYLPKENSTPKEQCKSKTKIIRCMNPLTTVTNQISKQTCAMEGGKPTDKIVVYTAECTKHKLINIYWTNRRSTQQLLQQTQIRHKKGHSISNHQEFLKCPWVTPQILLKRKPNDAYMNKILFWKFQLHSSYGLQIITL